MSHARRGAVLAAAVVLIGGAVATAVLQPGGDAPTQLSDKTLPDTTLTDLSHAVARTQSSLKAVRVDSTSLTTGKVDISIATPGVGDGADYFAGWQALLFFGSILDVANGTTPVASPLGTVTFLLPDGSSTKPEEIMRGGVRSGQAFDDPPDETLRATIQAVAGGCGLEPAGVTIYRGVSAAPYVRVIATDPNDFRACPDLLTKLFGAGSTTQPFEGWYFEVVTPGGPSVLKVYASARFAESGTWGSDAWAHALGIVHAGAIPTNISAHSVSFGGAHAIRGNSLQIRLRVPQLAHLSAAIRAERFQCGPTAVPTQRRQGWTRVRLRCTGHVDSGLAQIKVTGHDRQGKLLRAEASLISKQ